MSVKIRGDKIRQISKKLPLAVILTSHSSDYKEVSQYLTDLREDVFSGSIYTIGIFKGININWEVAIVETGFYNISAAVETERAIGHFNPRLIISLGIAGGIKDVAIGDVVAATKVYSYEQGKVASTFNPRPELFRSSYYLEQLAKREARKDDWLKKIDYQLAQSKPHVFIGPVVSGNKIIASGKNTLYKFVRQNYGDAFAVEMEGYGVLAANFANKHIDAIVIRGISDSINSKNRCDAVDSQRIAARNAAAFAFEILNKIELEKNQIHPSFSIYNIPYPRNPYFTGRESIINNIRELLNSKNEIDRIQILTGLRGSGKTQISLEYAYRNKDDYNYIWWIRSENPAVLSSDFAALADDLSLPAKGVLDQKSKIFAVRRWLELNEGWLLIFDEANSLEELNEFVPRSINGNIIISSQNRNWNALNKPIYIREFGRQESIQFLSDRINQRDEFAINRLADELGDLPLALEQASAYIESACISIKDYLERFKTYQNELLNQEDILGVPSKISTTWEIAFHRILEESPAAIDLLNLCSFLAPSDIQIDIFRNGIKFLPKDMSNSISDQLSFDMVLASLRHYSLIEIVSDTISINRFIQTVIRNKIDKECRYIWVKIAISLINEAFPFNSDDTSKWQECSRLVPHGLAVIDHAEGLGYISESVIRLFNQIALYLHGQNKFSEERDLLERALSISSKKFGPDSPIIANSLNNLGVALHEMGYLNEAKEKFELAIKISERNYGLTDPKLATNLNNLGSILQDIGALADAKEKFERALNISEMNYGSNHHLTATSLNNLGTINRQLGKLKIAKEQFEKALNINESIYGSNHPSVADLLNNLGAIHQEFGELDTARQLFEKALEIEKAVYGPDRPETAIVISNLGSVLKALGDINGASILYEKALEIDEQTYGINHPIIANRLSNLGSIHEKLGQLENARDCYERAKDIFSRFYGKEHPNTKKIEDHIKDLTGGK